MNLTYPQAEPFPSLVDPRPTVTDPLSPYYTPPANLSTTTNSTNSTLGAFSLSALMKSRAEQTQVLKRAMGQPLTPRRATLKRDLMMVREAKKREMMMRRMVQKRDLTGRANGTLDSWYGCFLWEEMYDYAVNYTFPWSECLRSPFRLSLSIILGCNASLTISYSQPMGTLILTSSPMLLTQKRQAIRVYSLMVRPSTPPSPRSI